MAKTTMMWMSVIVHVPVASMIISYENDCTDNVDVSDGSYASGFNDYKLRIR